MYTLYKFHFLNGISEINQLFDDILIIWPAPVFLSQYWSMLNKYISWEAFLIQLVKDDDYYYYYYY